MDMSKELLLVIFAFVILVLNYTFNNILRVFLTHVPSFEIAKPTISAIDFLLHLTLSRKVLDRTTQ